MVACEQTCLINAGQAGANGRHINLKSAIRAIVQEQRREAGLDQESYEPSESGAIPWAITKLSGDIPRLSGTNLRHT